jgi:uncharacterized membrane protein (UPF0127 family)
VSRAPHFLSPLLDDRTGSLALRVEGGSLTVANVVETAFDSGSRKRGLLGRDGLAADHALVIAPCNLIHTFRMTFAIDVVFAARDGRVLKVCSDVRPGRIRGAFRAFAVVEMAAGQAERSRVAVGQILIVT